MSIQETATDVANKTLEQAGTQLATTANDILIATSKAFPEIAGKGFEFYVRYIFSIGAADLIVGLLQMIFAIFILFYLMPRVNKMREKFGEDGSDAEGAMWALKLGLGVAIFAFTMAAISNLHSGTISMIAPEGAVINQIISNLGSDGSCSTRQQ